MLDGAVDENNHVDDHNSTALQMLQGATLTSSIGELFITRLWKCEIFKIKVVCCEVHELHFF